jgi:uncharacterized membrane protein YgcG
LTWVSFGLRHIFKLLALVVLLVGGLWWANHQSTYQTGTTAVTIDPANIYVSDNAGLLTASTKNMIKRANLKLAKRADHPQFLVVTVDRLPSDKSIEEFTNNLANTLGVGDADADSGVVYLVAKQNRQARLEVGYGMEATIPDAMTDQITDETVKNAYRQGDYDAGIRLVATRIVHVINTGKTGADAVKHSKRTFGDVLRQGPHWLITSIIGQILIVVAAGFVLFGCMMLVSAGQRLRGRLAVDQLWRHFSQDLHRAHPEISEAEALAAKPAATVKTAIAAMQQQRLAEEAAQPEGHLMRRPDYYDMAFAFGVTKPQTLIDNCEAPTDGFRLTSMYRQHWAKWFLNISPGLGLLGRPLADLPPRDRQALAPNLLTPSRKAVYLGASFVCRHWVVFAIGIGLLWRFSAVMHSTFSISTGLVLLLSQLFALLTLVLGWAFGPHAILVLAAGFVAFVSIWLASNWWTSLGDIWRQRTRLDQMMRRFLADLQAVDPKLCPEARTLALQLDQPDRDVALRHAKATLQTLNKHGHGKKSSQPDYMDMAFAFGSTTNAAFLISALNPESLAKTSMVAAHHDDWFPPDDDSSSGGFWSGSDSGGGGGFGGGSFGGGGGTSSW